MRVRGEIIGSYIGRAVMLYRSVEFLEAENEMEISQAVLCFIFESPYKDSELTNAWLHDILRLQPLAVAFYGKGAELAFDATIQILAKPAIKHTMTKLIKENDTGSAIRDFLHTTWPSEDRFSEWKSYVFFSVGSEEDNDAFKQVLLELVD